MRHWDGDSLVYNRLSGDTHLLDVVSGEIVSALLHGPAKEHELVERIAAFLDVPNDGQTAANVKRILDVLDDLGLVECQAACCSQT
jgi:PqqD family protein of HPr-rel-A system